MQVYRIPRRKVFTLWTRWVVGARPRVRSLPVGLRSLASVGEKCFRGCWSERWAESTAQCWPGILILRFPSPEQSSSHRAPWSALSRPPLPRAQRTLNGFSQDPEDESRTMISYTFQMQALRNVLMLVSCGFEKLLCHYQESKNIMWRNHKIQQVFKVNWLQMSWWIIHS